MRRRTAKLAPVALVAALPLVLPVAGLPASADEHLPEWPEVGSARVVPIQETGPPAERLNLVVMCDGYQAHEMDACAEDVDRNQAVQWSVEPFRTYRDYVNVYRLEIVSPESGVRCDPDEEGGPDPNKITPLRLVFSGGCVDPLARGVVYNGGGGSGGSPDPGVSPTGAQQRNFYLNEYVSPALGIPANSQNLQTLAIFNSFTYGGIGGTHATTSGGSPQGPLVSLHEIGHSLGNLQDEYPYSARPTPGPPHGNFEPSSVHHTRMSSEEMIANQAKWFRWLGEESEAGGIIRAADPDGYESGLYSGSNVWRPSEHSMMRWIGFYFDQIGREHMVARITGRRNNGQMFVANTPEGSVAQDAVLWVDPPHPKYHEVEVTWRAGGPDGEVIATSTRNLELAELDLEPGTVVHVEVRDPVGPDGLDWVRNPSTGNSGTNSGYNGPRFVQTREWTISDTPEPTPLPTPVELITSSSEPSRPLAGDEIAFVVTGHPAKRVLDVAWELDGEQIPNPDNSRTLDLGALGLEPGTYTLTATVTDPAFPDEADSVSWAVDNALPTAPRTLSEPLTTLGGDVEHPVYFEGWDMFLDPQDDRTGYDEDLYVVGELRLNEDGWFNYFGFPEEEDAPFKFRQAGSDVKALTYGNLGTGGLSKATFEQSYGPDDPGGPFVPGYGTHKVEHRAIDPAGNIGDAEEYRATVLPGEVPECTTTVSGTHRGQLRVTSGVTCLDGASVAGGVAVSPGASLVASDSTISGSLTSNGAEVIQLFGTTVNGQSEVSGTTAGVTAAGSTFNGGLILADNDRAPVNEWNERFSQFGYDYGPVLAGNRVNGDLTCTGNSAPARDFEAPNQIAGEAAGDCATL